MANLANCHWYCGAYPLSLWRTWEGEVFLFNPISGNTHILNQLSNKILSVCANSPHTLQDILVHITKDTPEFQSVGTGDLADHLSQLAQLGLIECLSDKT
ncbi:MAG: HPr-rel-A system PqqD family peptide chaperone [Gammaproteobacteria bacterium]|nr:HPr-rel-A system PqqD family peptide chaperone [Gammaproteobacteria bacterium]